MKILIACHGLWPKTPVGGMERETYKLCFELHDKKIDVTCAVPHHQVNGDEPFKTLGFSWPFQHPWLLANQLFARAVQKHLKKVHYDIAFSMGFALAAWRPIQNTRLIFHAEGLNAFQDPSYDPRWIWMRKITRHLAARATTTIAESENIRSILIDQIGLSPHKITIITPGVNPPRQKPFEPKKERGILLYVGRFSEEKGVDLLIDLLKKLEQEHFQLTAIGSGALENLLKPHVSQKFQIISPLPPEELRNYYMRASALLIPSRSEGIPQVALEALGYGTPVIASCVGGLRDLIDDKTVFGFPQGDLEKLTDLVKRLLNLSDGDRSNLSHAAYERGNGAFGLDRFVDDYIRLFETLTKDSPGTKLQIS